MNEESTIVARLAGTRPRTQPQTYSMEVNGLKYGPLVTLTDYEALREERDRAIRQRDHARGTASFYRSMHQFGVATYNQNPPPLTDADEDGWIP